MCRPHSVQALCEDTIPSEVSRHIDIPVYFLVGSTIEVNSVIRHTYTSTNNIIILLLNTPDINREHIWIVYLLRYVRLMRFLEM
jgi:hypothetical protein